MTSLSPTLATALSPPEFRDALARFATSVTVITTGPAERPFGCTATSVFSVSVEPPSIGASLTTGSRTLRAILDTGSFAVNVLAWYQWPLCQRFATGPAAERFAGVPLDHQFGVPVLARAASVLVCRVRQIAPLLDHTLVVGDVVHADARTNEPPLVSYQRQPHRLVRRTP